MGWDGMKMCLIVFLEKEFIKKKKWGNINQRS